MNWNATEGDYEKICVYYIECKTSRKRSTDGLVLFKLLEVHGSNRFCSRTWKSWLVHLAYLRDSRATVYSWVEKSSLFLIGVITLLHK